MGLGLGLGFKVRQNLVEAEGRPIRGFGRGGAGTSDDDIELAEGACNRHTAAVYQ